MTAGSLRESIVGGAPPEFGGKDYWWSPEHLLLSSLNLCLMAAAASLTVFLLFLIPRTRRNWLTLNLGCLLIWAGVYVEKGIGLVLPGMTPDALGEIYDYTRRLRPVPR